MRFHRPNRWKRLHRWDYNRHHRKPRHQGGNDSKENISVVPKDLHQLWTALFPGTMSAEQIVNEINEVWINPEFRVELKKVG